jgi:hypothetical protein
MHSRFRSLFAMAAALILGTTVITAGGVLAQDAATPLVDGITGRPAHIHEGNCPEPGAVVAPLTDLTTAAGGVTTPGTPAADLGGAIPAEYSFTTVEMSLDDLLAGEFAVNVHQSADQIDVYLACGDIGGTVDANGYLVIGLAEVEDSGFTGIAVLTANPDNAAATDVSVFISAEPEDDADDDA